MALSYRFGRFVLLVAERRLLQDGEPVDVGSRGFGILLAMLERRNCVLSKAELLDLVWPGLVVEEANVQVQISLLRKQIGSQAIATIPGLGYRLAVPFDGPYELNSESAAASNAPESRRIAVLPFTSLGRDDRSRWLAHGVAQDLIAVLSRNSDLRVISHHSSFAFASHPRPLAEIARCLRTRYIVDGSIDRIDEALRLRVELLDAIDERVVWTSQHCLSSAQLPVVQDLLMRKMGGSVHSRSLIAEARLALSRPISLDAYALVWRGMALLTQFTANAAREARGVLEKALSLEPNCAPAWAWLALLNALDATMRITGEWHPGRAKEYFQQAGRALELDPDNATACRAMAQALRIARNYEASLASAERAVELAPSNAHWLMGLSEVQCAVGRTVDALDTIERALDLDPLPAAWLHLGHAYALWTNCRLEEALVAASKGMAELPHYWLGRIIRMYALFELGQRDLARQEASILLEQLPRLTTTPLVKYWADTAHDLQVRALAASVGSGIPRGTH